MTAPRSSPIFARMRAIQPSPAEVAALGGNPARANMLTALLDGRVLTAAKLGHAGGGASQTASEHLAKLIEGRLSLAFGGRVVARSCSAGRAGRGGRRC